MFGSTGSFYTAAAAAASGPTITYDTLATIEALTPAVGDMGWSSDSIYDLRCLVAGTWTYYVGGVACTKPPTSGWTAFNGGSVAVSGGVRWITVPASTSGYLGETRDWPSDPTSTPYYAEFGIITQRARSLGAFQSDGTGMQMVNWEALSGGDYIWHYQRRSAPGVYVATDLSVTGGPKREVVMFRIEEDGTNRSGYVKAPDGTWSQLGPDVARTTTFTADRIGWSSAGTGANAGSISGLVHYAEGAL